MKFNGFEHLTANYLYCPNQFFDVCLPHHSRGTVRLVAYLLRKTLGWLDREGNPIEQEISISYRDLINEAGISRGAIRKALDEAVTAGFIICIQPGKANGNNQAAETAQYALRWDADNDYAKTPEAFNGFFVGEGYRTPIPNSFFDLIVRQETLAVVKVVGTVLRHTVGYQNQFGGRRQIAPLSYSYIQKYVNLSDRSTLSAAIQHAIETGYIHCVQKGGIDPSHTTRRPSTYAIRWHEQAHREVSGSKTRPAIRQRYKIQTSNGSETRPAERFKNQTEEKPQENNTDKQQNKPTVVAVENLESFQLLQHAGFDDEIARDLSQKRGLEEIQQQIEWLSHRNPDRNSLGMLRRAIEGNWLKPDSLLIKEKKQQHFQSNHTEPVEAEIEEEQVTAAKQEKKRRREQVRSIWNELTFDERTRIEQSALEQLNSEFFRDRFKKNEEFRVNHCLDVLSVQLESGGREVKHRFHLIAQ
ncbi:hypothetical protein [Gimesia fumaroli]|uniref:Uncharacterized protein n=1 Tax=Gimesia fumaroli TaxID=2527976 RepID=A0A518I5W0_9PLAN|nr:hypothetical protein [Gimesia fumaroli]QDV48463.1 hypothetical protein Enr17x_04750 [Gimesia fumaroli]